MGSLIIFFIVAMAMFSSFTQSLFNQERDLLNQGMTNISRQLGRINQPLTKKNISNVIDPDDGQVAVGSQYQRPIIQELSDGHLIVNIYDRNHQPILSTGKSITKPTFTNQRRVRMMRGAAHKVIVGQQPIYSQRGHRRIGYLQVENKLNVYYRNYNQLRIVVILAMCLVVLASGLLGYFLSLLFLRPLGEIHDTVKVISKDPTKNVRVPVPNHNDELAELTTIDRKSVV